MKQLLIIVLLISGSYVQAMNITKETKGKKTTYTYTQYSTKMRIRTTKDTSTEPCTYHCNLFYTEKTIAGKVAQDFFERFERECPENHS